MNWYAVVHENRFGRTTRFAGAANRSVIGTLVEHATHYTILISPCLTAMTLNAHQAIRQAGDAASVTAQLVDL